MKNIITLFFTILITLQLYHLTYSSGLFEWEKMWGRSYYHVLGVSESSTTKEIKKAYRKLAISLHPDKLQLTSEADKKKAEENFVRLAKAYEVLSDTKVKRKRYDYILMHDNILDYPDEYNFNWEWIDQKIGLVSMQHRDSSGPREKSRNDWTYEEARAFFQQTGDDEDELWSWEKDTTLQDIRNNPLSTIAIIGTLILCAYLPRLFRYAQSSVKDRRGPVIPKPHQPVAVTRSQNRGIRVKRRELFSLLNMHVDSLILAAAGIDDSTQKKCGVFEDPGDKKVEAGPADHSLEWGEIGDEESISEELLEAFCLSINTQSVVEKYIDVLQRLESASQDPALVVDARALMDHLLKTVEVKQQTTSRTEVAPALENDVVCDPPVPCDNEPLCAGASDIKAKDTIVADRLWTSKEMGALSKAAQKFPPGQRQRWEIIANHMNQQLAPNELFTKDECIREYQALRKNSFQLSSTKSNVSKRDETSSGNIQEKPSGDPCDGHGEDKTREDEFWTVEQQKQLEAGLKLYPTSLGMSASERWQAISSGVKGKSTSQCIRRYKSLRESIKEKRSK